MAFNLVRYSQQDPSWKENPIGGGPDTIGYIGCALTCVAMYASGWGYTETPATLNQKLTSHGGFIDEGIVWGAISQFHPQIRSTGITLCSNTDAPLAQIDASLAAGQPVIVEVDYSPDAGLQTHWVLLYARQGNDYLMQDPWPSPPETQPATLMSRFSQGGTLQRAIKAVAWYQCSIGASVPAPIPSTPSAPSAPSTPSTSSTPSTPSTPSTTPSSHPAPSTPSTPLPAPTMTDLVLQVLATATAGIKLHTMPSADSTAHYAEMPGIPLSVIEDKLAALSKIGQSNQWIYVRDPNGQQGYVAAWYVEAASVPAATPAPVPASTPPAPSTSSTPTTTPPASAPQRMQVVVIQSVGAAGLAVRRQPSPGADKVNDEKAGARLTVIEPPNTALPKIGQVGQWLAVKATNNQRGYVMAQYVQLRQ